MNRHLEAFAAGSGMNARSVETFIGDQRSAWVQRESTKKAIGCIPTDRPRIDLPTALFFEHAREVDRPLSVKVEFEVSTPKLSQKQIGIGLEIVPGAFPGGPAPAAHLVIEEEFRQQTLDWEHIARYVCDTFCVLVYLERLIEELDERGRNHQVVFEHNNASKFIHTLSDSGDNRSRESKVLVAFYEGRTG